MKNKHLNKYKKYLILVLFILDYFFRVKINENLFNKKFKKPLMRKN
jgi:hypothetical protein